MEPPTADVLGVDPDTTQLAAKVLDSLASAIAIIDHGGQVVATNWTWQQESLCPFDAVAALGPGDNFLEVCRASAGMGSPVGDHLADGTDRVLGGKAPRFEVQFEVPGTDGGRWFLLVVTPLEDVGAVVSRTETTTHHNVQDVFADLAFHDPLTGLPNRWLVLDRLRMALERSSRRGTWATVVFADLDGFKAINDTLGHAAGDQVLATVGRRMRDALRAEDTCGRWGGDEFVVVLEVGTPDIVPIITTRLDAALRDAIATKGGPVHVGVSLGVAIARSEETVEHLVALADDAMYRAKRSGRTVQFTALPGGGSLMSEL